MTKPPEDCEIYIDPPIANQRKFRVTAQDCFDAFRSKLVPALMSECDKGTCVELKAVRLQEFATGTVFEVTAFYEANTTSAEEESSIPNFKLPTSLCINCSRPIVKGTKHDCEPSSPPDTTTP